VRRPKKAFVSRDPVSQFEKSSVEEGDVMGAMSSDPPAEDWPSMNMHSPVSDAATIILITTCARWRDHPCTIPDKVQVLPFLAGARLSTTGDPGISATTLYPILAQ
jgi:hypothetical protein